MTQFKALFAMLFGFFSLSFLFSAPLEASPQGKVDLGVSYVEADIRLNSAFVKEVKMGGVSASGLLCLCQDLPCSPYLDGLALKPRFLLATGDADVWNVGLGIGYLLPWKNIYFIPHAGATYGELDADISFPFVGDLAVTFESLSPYVGLDLSFCFAECWQLTLVYEYAWPRTKTVVGGISEGRAESTGSNYACQLDYHLSTMWSLHTAVAVSQSRDKERNGMKVTGARVGAGLTF